jgi:Protein of unknown function (DUF1194)
MTGMRSPRFAIAAFTALWLVPNPGVATAAAPPALAVVLAIDVSASVNAERFVLQRDGIARAFLDRRLVDAITAVPGGIEALVLEWSDPDTIAITVEWRRIADAQSATAFSGAVHASARRSRGLTAIGPALLAAARQFDRLPQKAVRQAIDISGDGIANLGLPPAAARDRIVRAGITINALAILTDEPGLEAYYRAEVVGGAGAFVLTARGYPSFAEAMLRKLVLEVAGADASGSTGLAQMQ